MSSKSDYNLGRLKEAIAHKKASAVVGELYKFLSNNKLVKRCRATEYEHRLIIVDWFCEYDISISCWIHKDGSFRTHVSTGQTGSSTYNDNSETIKYITEYCLRRRKHE